MDRKLFLLGGLVIAMSACSQPDAANEPATTSGSYPSDMALGCPQIVSEITHENMVIKQANAASASTSSTGMLNQGGTGSPAPAMQGAGASFAPTSAGETPAQLAADQTGTGAVARANALVTLGKQKKCFF